MLSRAALLAQRPTAALMVRSTATSTPASAAASATTDEPLYRRPVRAEFGGKVRYGFIPEEWFQFFYTKTGVSGPYAFGVGLATYLCSKEIYVMEHEFYNGLSFAILLTLAIKKLGPIVGKQLNDEVDQLEAEWNQGRTDQLNYHQDSIKSEETEQWRADGQVLLVDIKKENVALQLEAAYRERLIHVYSEVKRRLDYQVACQQVDRTIKQKHLVNWVVGNVLKSITPDQEKENVNQCIADLAALAKARA